MFSGQLKKGDSHDKFRKCIHVSILDFSWFDDDLYYHTVHLYDDRKKERYSDLLELQFFVQQIINIQPSDLSIFPIAHIKNTQRSPLRLRLLICTLRKISCVIWPDIYFCCTRIKEAAAGSTVRKRDPALDAVPAWQKPKGVRVYGRERRIYPRSRNIRHIGADECG